MINRRNALMAFGGCILFPFINKKQPKTNKNIYYAKYPVMTGKRLTISELIGEIIDVKIEPYCILPLRDEGILYYTIITIIGVNGYVDYQVKDSLWFTNETKATIKQMAQNNQITLKYNGFSYDNLESYMMSFYIFKDGSEILQECSSKNRRKAEIAQTIFAHALSKPLREPRYVFSQL